MVIPVPFLFSRGNEQLRAEAGNGKPGMKATATQVEYERNFTSCSMAEKIEHQAKHFID